mmetsp:Transcript_36563/g.53678  ORF Transcript_36563/g.53678 Transcript_36563/m.53678 type:complete len:242 (-) Transcript_36563:285-1010(-)|eukprot:CAMPEP_0195521756 /NCGR_PEP_ID=MMETSP0794_2-20130614/19302_1 /TAXON_ID=515487 /ORGANISM="Stephanopyxis turris, Strain CCMP 815" /LENGTH=241 /DNA_ID=CAMNT_0040651375 /DNA_START=121 /DNA_END=846 /DNA_ORIENTATION=+
MPKSKRSQVVALTQTAKKTRDHKATVINDVREAIDAHSSLYLFSYENMRSNKFKNIRMDFRRGDNTSGGGGEDMDEDDVKDTNSSRIFLGKNKLLQIALGKTPEDEYADNLRQVSKLISGSVGLLLTNRSPKEVEHYFSNLVEEDFSRAGSTAPRRVELTNEMICSHPVSMVEQFRKLGLPVEVQNGKVGLIGGKEKYVVCEKGASLNAEQCKVLVHFGVKLAEFRVTLTCRWSDGKYEAF